MKLLGQDLYETSSGRPKARGISLNGVDPYCIRKNIPVSDSLFLRFSAMRTVTRFGDYTQSVSHFSSRLLSEITESI